ncbi:MAG: hypothetical protein SV583_08550 [Pseudomonadota bacterium]|nr:hypothetical protein [Pseudomonadota bacterium]
MQDHDSIEPSTTQHHTGSELSLDDNPGETPGAESLSWCDALAQRAQADGLELVDQMRTLAAQRADRMAHALQRAGEAAGEEGETHLQACFAAAGDKTKGMAEHLSAADSHELVERSSAAAREHPAVFYSGLLVGGFVLARLLSAAK